MSSESLGNNGGKMRLIGGSREDFGKFGRLEPGQMS